MADVDYRRFTVDDRMSVYTVFRTSLWSFLADIGLVDGAEKHDVETAWGRQKKLMLHTEETAAEDWVALMDGKPVGWARSVERSDHVQLTHFFVLPEAQGKGVGRALLDRAFSPEMGTSRSVMATINPAALSLYLRYGVAFRGVGFTFTGPPRRRDYDTDIVARTVDPSPESVALIADIESRILGYRRDVDIEFLLNDRPASVLYRSDEPVGYAFGSDGTVAGPGGSLDPADFPAVLAQVERTAVDAGQESMWITFPANAGNGVKWALQSGFTIDPFYEMLLASDDSIRLDRFMMTQPSFFW